ncbi:MAG: aldehyde ferredoxin oxidoreductase family protein [Candidatus Freyarchaeota archaeon]|nr:aldehyde ferredoxin oxidoreductase family protein [Candidatus Jordarchaeia archaeon]
MDPLSPKNKLIFAAGPLTGTAAPTGGRYEVSCKSPLTGTITGANSGGEWAAYLRRAGVDVIVFENKAKKPVYLQITDDKYELKSAEKLWGKDTHTTTDMLQKELGKDYRVACIGPAGEKLSRIACVINDKHRAAGRGGTGAVMGSKNLKAIAVKGTKKIEPVNAEAFKKAHDTALKMIKEHSVTGQGLPTYGTAILVNIINENGIFPTRNFQTGVFPQADKISGETMEKTILTKRAACFACPIGCGRVTEIKSGKYKSAGEGPEYETVWAYGAQCGVGDLAPISKANYLCNELGLDTISMGSTIGCAMELYQRGKLKKDKAGRELNWGDGDAIVELTEKTGKREGFGNDLAEGSLRLAEKYGAPELSMSAKGQELPAYDPRGAKGHGLHYATCTSGGNHVRGYMISPEILGIPEKLDRFATEGKEVWVKNFQDLTAVIDSIGMCLFTSFAIGAPEYTALLAAATGIDFTVEEVMKIGERIWNVERLFNIKAGFTAEDDTLPQRLLKEPMPEGPAKGHVVELDKMLPKYYKVRGWDENGVPTKEKIKELGI